MHKTARMSTDGYRFGLSLEHHQRRKHGHHCRRISTAGPGQVQGQPCAGAAGYEPPGWPCCQGYADGSQRNREDSSPRFTCATGCFQRSASAFSPPARRLVGVLVMHDQTTARPSGHATRRACWRQRLGQRICVRTGSLSSSMLLGACCLDCPDISHQLLRRAADGLRAFVGPVLDACRSEGG